MSPSEEHASHAVLTVAMDQRKRAALRLAFRMHKRASYTLFGEGGPAEPELAVVDADGPTGMQAWKEFRAAHPELPAVLLALNPVVLSDGIVVPKPVRVESLFPALQQSVSATERGRPGAAAGRPPSPPRGPRANEQDPVAGAYPAVREIARRGGRPVVKSREKSSVPPAGSTARKVMPFVPPKYFDPDEGLLGLLRRLQAQGKTAWIDTPEREAILAVLPELNMAHLAIGRDELRQLCETGTEVGRRPVTREAPELPAETELASLDGLIWQVAVWTSRGRLPTGLKIGSTVLSLNCWPNLTRLEPIPDGIRVAAFLARNRASIALTLKMLRVKPEHLYDFLSATHSVGLLQQAEKNRLETVAPVTPATPEAQDRRGLLSRFLARLVGT
jgi:hypothetical protein